MPHRVAMALKIVTMMTIAAAIPDVGGEGWTYFALGYALNRALTAYLYWRARCTDNAVDTLAQEQGRNFFVLAGVFALSAFLPTPVAYWVFAAGVAAIQLQYMLPRVGTLRFERFVPQLGHISERFGVAAAVLSNVGCDLAVAVGVATERRLLTYSTLLVGAVQVAPRRCACAWQPPANLHPALHAHLHTHPPAQCGKRACGHRHPRAPASNSDRAWAWRRAPASPSSHRDGPRRRHPHRW